MGFKLGYFAGTLGDIFLEDNERVSKATDSTLDSLANLVIRENEKRTEKVEAAKENISRLEALGFKRPVAASIARGGLLAVNDAVKNAGTAKEYGEDVNSYYAATATFKPEDYADYTIAQMAEAVVPVMDISKSAEILTKGKRINTDRVNEAVGKYKGYTPTGSDINVPIFAQDVSKMGGGRFDVTELSSAATFLDKLVKSAARSAGETTAGYKVDEIDGRMIGSIRNADTYSKWLQTEVPKILELQKESMTARAYRALEAASRVYIQNITQPQNVQDSDDSTSSGKAVPKGTGINTNVVKQTIRDDIDSGISREESKAEAINDGIDGDLFDQLYDEAIRLPSRSGRNIARGMTNAPIVNPPAEAASEQFTGTNRRSARTGR